MGYSISARRPEMEAHMRNLEVKWENYMKANHMERGCGVMDWTGFAQEWFGGEFL
jgi:hypothetical protein